MTEKEAKQLEKDIKDQLLYLHEGYDDRGEFSEISHKELADRDWNKVKLLIKHNYLAGYKVGLRYKESQINED